MSRFVRPSKYRHVYGTPAKPEGCYQNVKVTNNAWDTNLLAANKSYLSLNWQAGGGGAFAIIPTSATGKLPDVYPLCRGHTATVLDTAFSPFDDRVVVSGADDGQVGIWKIEDQLFDVLSMSARDLERHGGVKDMEPAAKIAASNRKIGQVVFHPTASNTVAAAGGDHIIKLWDIETQQERSALSGFTDAVQSLDFDWTGSTLVATCRDRKLRTFDARKGGAPVQTVDSHPGIKGARVVWCGSTDRIITTGFSKTSDRQMNLWDSNNLAKPLKTITIDTSSGVVMPFYSDNSIVFLAGKGDGNVRYYELDSDEIHYLSEYKSTDPQRGMTFLPRRDLNADENEIARAYKVTNNMIQPISFTCPRRENSFQSDIFPPAPSSVPALTGQEFFSGKTALPNLVSLQDGKGVDSKSALPAGSSSSSAPSSASTSAPSRSQSAAQPAPAAAPTPVTPAAPKAEPTPALKAEPSASLPQPSRASTRSTQVEPTVPSPTKAAPAKVNNITSAPAKENGSASAGSSSSSSSGGLGDLANQLNRLSLESAARDARLRELEIENERLRSGSTPRDPSPTKGKSFSTDRFFETQTPPSNLEDFASKAQKFVDRHHGQGRKIVLVTSGGTTVPLEQNVVRFLDNFSAGTRGATSAEYFLSQGYAVVFLHRQHSLCPYTRHYSHTTNPFLDLLEDPSSSTSDDQIRVTSSAVEDLRPVLSSYLHHARPENQGGQGTLLRLPFVTVNDYLFMLREMASIMSPLRRNGLYYLAAAVSDFFVPNQRTPQHKLQSGKGSLVIEMDQVPKVLNTMVEKWAKEAFIVSFKLETDPELLIPKAKGALERYGHQIVIANDLNRRKEEVCFVYRRGGGNVTVKGEEAGDGFEVKWLKLNGREKEIEEDIVGELVQRHDQWVREGGA